MHSSESAFRELLRRKRAPGRVCDEGAQRGDVNVQDLMFALAWLGASAPISSGIFLRGEYWREQETHMPSRDS